MVALVFREKWILFSSPPPFSFLNFLRRNQGDEMDGFWSILVRDKLVEIFPFTRIRYLFGLLFII